MGIYGKILLALMFCAFPAIVAAEEAGMQATVESEEDWVRFTPQKAIAFESTSKESSIEDTVRDFVVGQFFTDRNGEVHELYRFYDTHLPQVGWRKMTYSFYEDDDERLDVVASEKDEAVMFRFRFTLPSGRASCFDCRE